MRESTQLGPKEAYGEGMKIKKLVDEGKAKNYDEGEKIHEEEKWAEARSAAEAEYFCTNSFINTPPEARIRYQDRIDDITDRMAELPWQKDDNAELLIISNSYSHSGQALSPFGLYTLKEKIFSRDNFESSLAMAIHERTHLQLGSELRQSILVEHKDIDDFFHKIILPKWERQEIALRHDQYYITSKSWESLYGDTFYAPDIKIEQAIDAVNRYFILFKKGLVKFMGKELYAHWPSEKYLDSTLSKENIPLEELYEKDPDDFILKLMTGYELAEYLEGNYRWSFIGKVNRDFLDMDEGFASYMSSAATGIDLDELYSKYRQDESKTRMAREIMKRTKELGIGCKDALQKVRSYGELIDFCKELGIADWRKK